MHILVTGAGGNLGKAVIHSALNYGYEVTGMDKSGYSQEHPGFRGEGSAQFLNHQSSTLPHALEVDLSDESSVEAAVAATIARMPVDVAVLTAGGFAMGSVSGTPSSQISDMYRLNFLTTYHVARPVFRHMMERGRGRIFFVGARPGLDPGTGKEMAAYTLSKSLVFGLAQLLNAEAGEKDVVTSVVVPSVIDTPSNRQAMPEADFEKWVAPEEIARVILWHAGPDASALREPLIKVYGKS